MKKILWLLLVSVVVGSAFLGNRLGDKLNSYAAWQVKAADALSMQVRTKNLSAEMASSRSETETLYQHAYRAQAEAQRIYHSAYREVYGLALLMGMYLLAVWLLSWQILKQVNERAENVVFVAQQRSVALIAVALICLWLGLTTPMLEVAVYLQDFALKQKILFMDIGVTFYGEMYALYGIKSVFHLLQTLYENGSYLVLFAISCFSIVIPVVKLGISLVLLFSHKARRLRGLQWLVAHIGKWSMGDVFVVAIFLGMLGINSMAAGVQTSAQALFGVGFFFFYVVFSLISSVFLQRFLANPRVLVSQK